jgi:tetratricopeptide (TPR) repeat protein
MKEAEQIYRRAIALDPDASANAGAYDGLAAVLQDTGDLEGAIIASKKAAHLRGNADDTFGVGNTLEFLGRIPDAVEMFRLATTQKDDFADAHVKAARHLLNLGLPHEAVTHYQAAAQAMPQVAELHCNLANARQLSGDANGALDSARLAIELKPQLAEAHNIMGLLWKERRRWADSLAAFNKALQVKPDSSDVLSNMGVVLELVGRESEATAYFERAVAIRPEVPHYHLNLARNLLLLGDYRRGFAELEWRRFDAGSPAGRNFPQPMWNGSPLNDQTILIHAENPLGQTVQFLRYVKLVADRGGRVLLECQPRVAPLARNMPGVSEIIIQGDALPRFDVHCPIVTLARVFGTSLQAMPGNVPYINPTDQKRAYWAAKMPDRKARLRVGLAWQDPANSTNSRDRALTADKLIPLSGVSGVEFFNLQQLETPLPADLNLVDLKARPEDLSDTAAIIDEMDLVIGTDTAAAHVAAAMGKKTFILLPSTPDWRWLCDREDSPWYPSVRLFRQSAGRSWTSVVDAVKTALKIAIGSA